ncbi:MAG TPA: energy transducer TonB [Steroidobacteraceae bacterium]|nr:energy transducer TonB [Steroidobacteraceae bacterium]
MNLFNSFALLPFALAGVAFAPVVLAQEAQVCAPKIVDTRTAFPTGSQNAGHHGLVKVGVKLGADGTVAAASIVKSSGFAALDRAALASVRDHWRFDVAHCGADQLALERVVDITYRSAAEKTLSGTVNTKATSESKRLLAESQCHIARSAADTVYACLQNTTASLANTK